VDITNKEQNFFGSHGQLLEMTWWRTRNVGQEGKSAKVDDAKSILIFKSLFQ
jgi:hypothetical protein